MGTQRKSQGFGDDVKKLAKMVKADKAADKIAKALGMNDCGCDKRAEALNNPNLLVNKLLYNKENEDTKEEQGD